MDQPFFKKGLCHRIHFVQKFPPLCTCRGFVRLLAQAGNLPVRGVFTLKLRKAQVLEDVAHLNLDGVVFNMFLNHV